MGGNEDRRGTVEDFSTSPRNMKDWVIGEESSGRSHQGHYPMKCLNSFWSKYPSCSSQYLDSPPGHFSVQLLHHEVSLGVVLNLVNWYVFIYSLQSFLFSSIEAHLSFDGGLKVAKVVGLALWETLHQQLCDLNLYLSFVVVFCICLLYLSFVCAFVKVWVSMLIWWEFS